MLNNGEINISPSKILTMEQQTLMFEIDTHQADVTPKFTPPSRQLHLKANIIRALAKSHGEISPKSFVFFFFTMVVQLADCEKFGSITVW